MDIRNSPNGLKNLLGITPPVPNTTQQESSSEPVPGELSKVGSEIASTVADSDVRLEKIAHIKAALAAGTYNIPATAVASRIVDAMLENKR
jgi:flagellar biosynthesis anti-sigma factor FlgM